jgi:PEP-CTERM motif
VTKEKGNSMKILHSKSLYLYALIAASSGGLSVPAHATLQVIADVSGSVSACVDNAACDSNPAIGIIQIGSGILNGVQVNGSLQTSTGTPANPGPDILNTSSLSIINLTDITKTVTIVVSDTDFTGPVGSWASSASGTWQNAVGSHITMNWYDDPTNAQGASAITDTPGILIDTFSAHANSRADSFSHNGEGPVLDSGPFSMSEQAILTLAPRAELLSRGQTEIKVAIPEPSTWAMMLLGFAGLGYAAFRRAAKSRRAAAAV